MGWTGQDATLAGTVLAREQLLPAVVLTEPQTGREWRPSQLRQRSAVVLCFMHDDCQPCRDFLAGLAELEEDIGWVEAQVRVVLPEPETSPFPVLVDTSDSARERVLGPAARAPTLVIADRYTAAVEAYPAGDHDFPPPAKVVSTLRHLAMLCPECGV